MPTCVGSLSGEKWQSNVWCWKSDEVLEQRTHQRLGSLGSESFLCAIEVAKFIVRDIMYQPGMLVTAVCETSWDVA